MSELTREMTVVECLGVAGDARKHNVWGRLAERTPNARVCWRLNVAGWKSALESVLR